MGQQGKGRGKTVRAVGVLAVIAFAVTMAIVVGNRLSDQALAVLAGAVCGVGAAIPTSLLIVAVTRRRQETKLTGPTQREAYPPVIVVSPPQVNSSVPQGWNGMPASLNGAQPRSFTVVGQASMDGDEEQVGRRVW